METENNSNDIITLQKENLYLKQSITVLRNQMERMEIEREEALQNILHSMQNEILQLRETIAAMRNELEKKSYEKESFIQKHLVLT
jgi:predicted RNase H-like nuclease (RuvC/YqgF family)